MIHGIGELAYRFALGPAADWFQNNVELTSQELQQHYRWLSFASVFGTSASPGTDTRASVKHWGAKAFPDQQSAKGLLWLYPEARFIYLFRDGLEVVASMSKFDTFAQMSFEQRCRFWSQRVFQYEYLRAHDRSISISFQDFVDDNQGVFERIFDHLQVDHNPEPARFASSTLVHPLDEPTRKSNPKQVLRQRHRQHKDWSREQQDTFREICGEAMQLLGYDMDL